MSRDWLWIPWVFYGMRLVPCVLLVVSGLLVHTFVSGVVATGAVVVGLDIIESWRETRASEVAS